MCGGVEVSRELHFVSASYEECVCFLTIGIQVYTIIKYRPSNNLDNIFVIHLTDQEFGTILSIERKDQEELYMTGSTGFITLDRAMARVANRYDMTVSDVFSFVSDERSDGNGFWVYLQDGWINEDMECGTIHEDTVGQCIAMFDGIRRT